MAGLLIFSVFILVFTSQVNGNDDDWKVKMERKMEQLLGILENQRSEIALLKHKVVVLEKTCKQSPDADRQMKMSSNVNISKNETAISDVNKSSFDQTRGLTKIQKRLLLFGNEVAAHAVAFYAYISKNFGAVGNGHIYVFDTIITNQGNAYNKNTGAFTAPTTGVFAFAWTAFAAGEHLFGESGDYGEVSVHLVQNSQYKGSIYIDTETTADEEMATGFAILHLQAGDVVMVKSPIAGQGSFSSSDNGRWSFSGFQIA